MNSLVSTTKSQETLLTATSNAPAIDVQNVSRIYDTTIGVVRRTHRQICALDGISLSIEQGELFGLVGPNGAGKTTLIKILTTLLVPTSGSAKVLGLDVARQEKQIRGRINAIFGGERGLYTRLSGEDNLRFFADLYRVPRSITAQRIPQLLEIVGLEGREKERVEGYSKGMKQRLHIAKALINDPEVLFLDEPTIGLDPNAARKLRSIISNLETLHKTVILTSHYMQEVDALCKRVAVINKGQMLAIDSPYNLKRHVAKLFVVEAQIVRNYLDADFVGLVKGLDYVENATLSTFEQRQTLTVQTSEVGTVVAFLERSLPAEDLGYIITREPTLEDAYVKMVGAEA